MKFTPTILFGVVTVVVAIIAVVVVSLKNKEGFGQNYNERICNDYPIQQGPSGGKTKSSCENYLRIIGCGPTVPDSSIVYYGKCGSIREAY